MMRLFRFLVLSGIVLMLCSCAASRNSSSQTSLDYESGFTEVKQMISSLSARLTVSAGELSSRLQNLKVTNTTNYYSAPDSSGRQYLVSSSNTGIESDVSETSQTTIDLNLDVTFIREQLDSINHRLDALYSKNEQTVQLSWWDLNKDKVYLGLFILVLVSIIYVIIRLRR